MSSCILSNRFRTLACGWAAPPVASPLPSMVTFSTSSTFPTSLPDLEYLRRGIPFEERAVGGLRSREVRAEKPARRGRLEMRRRFQLDSGRSPRAAPLTGEAVVSDCRLLSLRPLRSLRPRLGPKRRIAKPDSPPAPSGPLPAIGEGRRRFRRVRVAVRPARRMAGCRAARYRMSRSRLTRRGDLSCDVRRRSAAVPPCRRADLKRLRLPCRLRSLRPAASRAVMKPFSGFGLLTRLPGAKPSPPTAGYVLYVCYVCYAVSAVAASTAGCGAFDGLRILFAPHRPMRPIIGPGVRSAGSERASCWQGFAARRPLAASSDD